MGSPGSRGGRAAPSRGACGRGARRRLAAALALLLAALGGGPGAAGAQALPELESDTLWVEGRPRTFRLYAPASIRDGAPLVLALHASVGDGSRLRGFVGRRLEELADRGGFVVAYPDGWGGYWNDCRAAAPFPANRLDVDDPAFLRALVARLRETHGVDPARVRALGFSNGGHMAYRLALEAGDELQAVAVFAATLPAEEDLDCVPSGAAVPVLVVAGTADPISPFGGGEVRVPDGRVFGRVRSALETGAWLARRAGLAGEPRRETLLARDPATGLRVERLAWSGGGAPEVVLLVVHGGGHVIPGPEVELPAELGPLERRLDAIEEAVRFFERQPPAGGAPSVPGAAPAAAPGPAGFAEPGGAACGLAGATFSTTVTVEDSGGDSVTAGRWRIAFAGDGRFTAEQDGAAAVEGRYDLERDRVTFRDEVGTMACEGRAGTYRLRRSGDLLEMEVLTDPCASRTAVLTAHPLRRVEP